MIPQLVIFDCDGVLVDTEGPTAEVIAANLTGYGLPITAAQVDALFTGGTMESVEAEAKTRGAALPSDWLDEIYGAIFARLDAGVALLPGLMDLLDALDTAGVAQFVASNGPMAKMQRSLGPSGLWDRFGGEEAGRILSREHHRPKPDPAMILHALARTGADPARTVMIDDSPTGCRAALAAGVRCIGFDAHGQTDRLTPLGIELAPDMATVRRMILT